MDGREKVAANNKKRRILNMSLAVIGIIVVGLLFNKILEQWAGFREIIDKISGAFAPIIVGAVIAFLMNPILVFFDRLFHTLFQDKVITDKKKLFKVSRTLAVILTTIVFLGIITGVVWLVVPQLYDSIKQLVGNMDNYYYNLQNMVENINEKFQKLNIPEDELNKYMNTAYLKLQDMLNTKIMPNVDKIVVNIGSGVFSGLKFLYNFLIGIVASIYVMANKEYLASRGKKIIYAMFKVKNANNILDGLSEMYRIFGQFINGKILDSLIIGLIMFIVSTILNLPYAVLISVIVGVTNVIPFFGPIIGAIPCFFIVLIADPIKSLVLLLVILILQQFDGNILGPKIIGDTTGLSSFWVLTAVIVGGGLFGFFGMLLGVPVFACCYMYINRTCTAKLQDKNLAFKTSEYEKIKRIDEETGEPIYRTEEEEDIRFKKKTPEQKLEERENKRKLKQKQHMLQYPSDLPDDEYVKPESKQSRSEEVSEDDSEDDPISIIDKFVHVMRTVASKADAEKLAKDIVEEGKKPEHDIDNNDKSKVNETPTNDDGETYK
ncbi:MAG: AI-2E family transporter [Clostridiales bacterium]|nr:AI-2E family transporter [Clostridiales bacterium]